MDIISLFSSAGGVDLGFKKAGFNTVWGNDIDKDVWDTFSYNFPKAILDKRDIRDINSKDIPDCIGIIGGPPCQSWSEAGARRGIDDERGKLFFEYIRILKDKKPLFFVAENVSGILHTKNKSSFENIINKFAQAGYNIFIKLINAKYYNVPQDRKRIIIIGVRTDKNIAYSFPTENKNIPTLQQAIFDLKDNVVASIDGNYANKSLKIPNHEYLTGGYSTMFMSRNRVRKWDEPSFTIQAGGRHAPIHPQAPIMLLVEKDKRRFVEGKEDLYRRLSVRECARIQTFPDNFIFKYKNVANGYKMVGNAVPVNLAYEIAKSIRNIISI
jgi:DNA (cytosine-5)-methyltransferase 1